MNSYLKPALGLLAITLLSLPGRAAVLIPVGNYDFTSPATASYYLASGAGGSTAVDDWSFSNTDSVGGVAVNGNVPVAVGQAAFFNNTDDGSGGYPVNTITYSGVGLDALPTITKYYGYTLTVALAFPGGNGPTQLADYSVSLLAGSSTFTATANNAQLTLLPSTIGYTNFYDLSVNLSAAYVLAHPTLIGQQLGIVLSSNEDPSALAYLPGGNFTSTSFSDVRLTETPEPSTWALIGVGALVLLWRANRKRLA